MQFERHLEACVIAILSAICPNNYPSRTVDTAQTPRTEIKAVCLGIFQNQKLSISAAPGWIYSAYAGTLEITVKTNRTTEKKSGAHYELLGDVRANLQQFAIDSWNLENSAEIPIAITDIREGETEDSFVDQDDIDTTKFTQNIIFAINPLMLQDNL